MFQLFLHLCSLFRQQSTVEYGPASDQIPSPTGSTLEPVMTARIVGPMIYLYFSTANSSDAGFTVDLLFQYYSYAEVCLRFVLLSFALYWQ